MREIYRILDANFNRAREALRVAEDCGRFAMNDPAITAMAKTMRSDLKEILDRMPVAEMLTSRDTPGDIGTEITSPVEMKRHDMSDVASAAMKRLSEALRSIEEYAKIVAPQATLQIERMRYDSYTLEQRLISRLSVAMRFADVRVYALITPHLCRGSVLDTARAALAGGAEALQLRAKDQPDAATLAMAAELRELTDEMGRMLIINDRPDIAAIVGADGVHLGQSDLPLQESRRLLRPGAIVGRSTHNMDQVRTAANEGADYIAVGPIFQTATKDAGAPVGPQLVAEACRSLRVPVVAIGGITTENVAQVFAAGCSSVAVSSCVCSTADPRAAVEALQAKIAAARRSPAKE